MRVDGCAYKCTVRSSFVLAQKNCAGNFEKKKNNFKFLSKEKEKDYMPVRDLCRGKKGSVEISKNITKQPVC